MTSEEGGAAQGGNGPDGGPDVDVVIVGTGILGIHQLYITKEAGFTVASIEAGSGVGGTWYWNRYPEARFDSESYTYGYLFSEELFDEWRWSEHFAGQPEIERYINHVVDKFDLRRHIHFNARVTSAVWDDAAGVWTVTADDGTVVRARYLIPTTGVLSIPYLPDVPGRETFEGEAFHTGLWPKDEVTFDGKRVAVIGTGSSGVQLVPAIADRVESLTVYQRNPNWATPLNNRPITEEEQAELRADFESLRENLNTSVTGFFHQPSNRKAAEDSAEQRQVFYERMWKTPGFGKLIQNYSDMMLDPVVNKEWCEFLSRKISALVDDPETADKLIPKDHRFGEKRPPMVTNYFETYNKPNVELVDIKANPMVRVTATGIETTDGHREFDMICWATGFDFGTGALRRLGIRGRHGLALEDYWSRGPITFIGTMAHGFPNMFFPGGPHGTAGNNPRYGGDQVEFTLATLVYMREHGHTTIEVAKPMEDEWMHMVETLSAYSAFTDKSYFYGTNIPGKPRAILQSPGGRGQLFEFIAKAREDDHQGFVFDHASADDWVHAHANRLPESLHVEEPTDDEKLEAAAAPPV